MQMWVTRRLSIKKISIGIAILFVITSLVVGYLVGYARMAQKASNELRGVALDLSDREAAYPDIDETDLSDTQQGIVTLTKREFLDQPPGTKYSEGIDEDWCADFVSWVMKEVGEPLSNPNSGSWRIPGTYTLYDYYVAEERFQAADSGYEPQLGDIAIYRGSPVFGDHTNIVLSYRDGMLTTVGGNEGDRIRVYENTKKEYGGLLGYGVLSEE